MLGKERLIPSRQEKKFTSILRCENLALIIHLLKITINYSFRVFSRRLKGEIVSEYKTVIGILTVKTYNRRKLAATFVKNELS